MPKAIYVKDGMRTYKCSQSGFQLLMERATGMSNHMLES